jgi:serine/threonine protein kinase
MHGEIFGQQRPRAADVSSLVATTARAELVVGMEAKAGHLLGGRFVLQRFVESRSLTKSPGESFPGLEGFHGPKHLGQGSFGDVWEVYDEKLQKKVAVKIFYQASGDQKHFLTWNSSDVQAQAKLEEAAKECLLVQDVLKQSYLFPQGASRICECYEDHVTKQRGTDELTFIVLELCGRGLASIGDDLAELDASDRIPKVRELTQQVLEGIAFMNMLDPPLIHHDLKPDNVVALEDAFLSGFGVKIVDFGEFVWGLPQNQRSRAAGDPAYMPPEFMTDRRVAFRLPAYTFDVYGAGVIHMLLACPDMNIENWSGLVKAGLHQSWAGENCADLPAADLEFILSLTGDYSRRPDPSVAMHGEIFGWSE